MPSLTSNLHVFGEFRLDPQARVLRRGEDLVAVTPKALEVLLLLVQRNGEVVSKEELMNAVWPDSFVEESNLTQTVFMLRKALGESSERRFILTVPGRGYRFVARIQNSEPIEPARLNVSLKDSTESRSLPWFLPALVIVSTSLLVIAAVLFLRISTHTPPQPFASIRSTRLTGAGTTAKAAISPDGRYVAHSVVSAGQESLLVRRTRALDDIELVSPQPVRYMGLCFSPDGELIYYVIRKASDGPGILYRVPVIGGSSQKIKENINSPISVSPDKKRYAFVRERGDESALVIAEFASGAEQIIITHKLPIVVDYPAWSPDGKSIAYTVTNSVIASPVGSDARIVAVRLADGVEENLSSQRWGFVKQLAWMSNGGGLVLSARALEESGLYHLWHLSYPKGQARQITSGLNKQVGASISADAASVVTVEERAFTSIWRTNPSRSQHLEPVVSGASGTSAPVWDSNRNIVFEEELDGRRSIFSIGVDGSNRKELTLTANNYDHSISKDGRRMAWVSDRSGTPAIWTMDMSTDKVVMLAPATGEPVPQIAPDGTWIAFTAIGKEYWTTLWRVSSGGGPAVELDKKLWLNPVISPDGKWIAGFYADRQLGTQRFPESIAIISSNGGSLKIVARLAASVSIPAGLRWNPDGRALTYIDHGKDGDNVWSQPCEGGAPRQLTHFEGLTLFSFDWSPDGGQLALSRGVLARDVVLIEDVK